MEIAPHVHQIDLGSVNAYLVAESDGLTLIDAGMPRRAAKILDYVRQLGRQPSDVKRILITHADIDHAGSLAAVQRETGAAVFASRAAADLARHGKGPKHNFWIMDTVMRLVRYPAASAVGELIPGQTLPVLGGLETIDTPGHTLDHISFFSPSTGVAFIGDLLNTREGKLQLTPTRITADMAQARQSAAALLGRNPTHFACGHGTPLSADHPSVAALRQSLGLSR